MTRGEGLGAILIVVGALAAAPGLLLVGAMTLLTAWLARLWSRRGLSGVTYERRLRHDRAVFGDVVPLDLVVTNGKLLPLAWLKAEDFVTDGTVIAERPVPRSDRPGYSLLENTWTFASYERVVRHLHLVADHRGVFRLGPVRLSVADLFARDAATEERPIHDTFIVRPRTVPVRLASPTVAPMGTRRARQGLQEDPALFSGVRPFQLGDSRRRLHWRATARVGQPVSKRFEPSTVRETLIALDVQTTDAAYWLMVYEEELLESLMVAAASIARYLIGEGTACGLAAAAWTGSLKRIAFLPPAGGEAQLNAIADVLGRLSAFASSPFGFLLGTLPERLSPGTSILVLSGRDPTPVVAIERRLARNGSPVTHVALGERREAWAEIARRYGVEARTATLHGGWRTSDALDLAG